MPPFDPNPGDVLHLPCVEAGSANFLPYSVEPSSLNKTMAYASQGGKAIIYRLSRDSDKTLWALKVFDEEFRNAEILRSSRRLTELATLPGFKAAKRSVIVPNDKIVVQHPDLEWAVLMPWVTGKTCFDVFGIYIAKNKNQPFQLPVTVTIAQARRLVEIQAGLEYKGYAHTDISSGNFVLDYDPQGHSHSAPERIPDSQLIDIEDVWFPGIVGRNSFTDGYGHPSMTDGATTACPEGDRYATTILTAELLLLTNYQFAKHFEAGGYFQDNRNDPKACRRYEEAQKYLKTFCPDFADMLAQAWCSRTLADCGRIADLWPTLKPKEGFVPPPLPSLVEGVFGPTTKPGPSGSNVPPMPKGPDPILGLTPAKSVPPPLPPQPLKPVSPTPAPMLWEKIIVYPIGFLVIFFDAVKDGLAKFSPKARFALITLMVLGLIAVLSLMH